MKNIILTIIVLVMLQAVNAHAFNKENVSDSSSLRISEIFVFYRALPVLYNPTDTTSTKTIQVEININFSLSAPSKTNQVSFNLGTSEGGSDILVAQYNYINKNGNDYLSYQDQLYPIVNGQVSVRAYTTPGHIVGTSYASINAVDVNGNYSNILSQTIQ